MQPLFRIPAVSRVVLAWVAAIGLAAGVSHPAFGNPASANLATVAADDLPLTYRTITPLHPVGGDELKLFGFRVYRATLWAPEGRFEPDQPHAFSLRYRRAFTVSRLVDITVTAWEKAGTVPAAQRQDWANRLLKLWPDVRPGDLLVTVVRPGGETRFYNAAGLLGQIDDPAFGPAFLGIWLDERTLLPDLRLALLGKKRLT